MKFIRYFSCIFLFLLTFSLCSNEYDFPDPYPEIYESIEVLPLLRHGWHIHENEVNKVFSEKNIKTVVEVGCWLGNWTIYVAQLLPVDGKFFAVDHWKGSVEHYNHGSFERTLLPTLYQQFLSNIIHYRLTDKVIPVRMDSLNGAIKFKLLGIRPDLIYIDASHDYNSVMADISAWYPLLVKGGIFCGDDWNLGEISVAVKDYAKQNNLKVCFTGEFWWYE